MPKQIRPGIRANVCQAEVEETEGFRFSSEILVK